MVGWGRNAAVQAGEAPARKRYGRYSILLALTAPAVVLAAGAYIVSLPTDASESAENVATILALVAYGLVAPIMHIAGVGYGIAGLRSTNAGKVSSVIGIILNIVMIAVGLLFGWAAVSSIGAFT